MSMDKSAIEAIQESQKVAAVTVQLREYGAQMPVVAVPDGVDLRNLERYFPGRFRTRGTMGSEDVTAFLDYTRAKAKSAGVTTFVATDEMSAVSIFNLGTDECPGHGDDTAVLVLPPTAEMRFLLHLDNTGKMSQQRFAELVEEWRDYMAFYHSFASIEDHEDSSLGQALAAIRKVDVKTSREQSSSEGEFNRERSDLEKIEVISSHLPGFIRFKCQPYNGLEEREFWIRVTTYLEGSAPQFGLRVIRMDLEQQRMREELFGVLDAELTNYGTGNTNVTVYQGAYKQGS